MEAALSAAMKSAIGVLLLLVTVPMFAQDLPPEFERATLLSVGGPVSWGVGINGQAVGWAFARAHPHVSVSARLGNGGGHAYLDAYLMTRIGPGTTEEHQIARTTFDLQYPHDGWVELFTDLDLEAGAYWLVIAKPRERAHSSINWFVAQPADFGGTCHVRMLGSQSYTFHGDAAEYLPASRFAKKYEPYAFQFEVTEVRETGTGQCH